MISIKLIFIVQLCFVTTGGEEFVGSSVHSDLKEKFDEIIIGMVIL
jgi:hypothetical protein